MVNTNKTRFGSVLPADKDETLLRIWTKNFGEVPSIIHEELHAIHDLDVLGQLTVVALDCESLDGFDAALRTTENVCEQQRTSRFSFVSQ